MAGKRITKVVVDRLAVPAGGQAFILDTTLKGFGVRAGSSGVKRFVVQYRSPDDRLRRYAFGRFPVLTIEAARQEALRLLGDISRGVDPADVKKAKRDAPTMAEVCDWYLQEAEAGRLLGRRRLPIKLSTVRMDRSRIERHIKPLVGSRKVANLKAADIEAMQSDITAGKTSAGKGNGRGRVTTGGGGAASRDLDAPFLVRARDPDGRHREQPGSGCASDGEPDTYPAAERGGTRSAG